MVDNLNKEAVLAQLDLVLSSEFVRNSPRTKRFLTYLVHKTLDGEPELLKGYSIGLDVFDRPSDFDPQIDSIVRVQAGRLRQLLKTYYAGPGKDDPIIIALPKGTYVPVFQSKTPQGQAKPKWQAKRYVPIVASILFALVLATFLFSSSQSRVDDFEYALNMPNGPSVTVFPFQKASIGQQDSDRILEALTSDSFRMLVTEKLSRFRNLKVIYADGSGDLPPLEKAKNLGVDYYLNGSVRVEGDRLNLTIVLARTADSSVIWSDSFDRNVASAASIFDLEADIALGIVAALGASNSALREDFVRQAMTLEAIEAQHYVCLLEFFEYVDRKREDTHLHIRNCLEASTRAYPDFSSGWAALSWMYGDEQRNGFNVMDANGFERSLEAALKAVAADPRNAMAQQYLAIAQFALGNDAGFRRAADAALHLNPNDPDVLADVGSHLIQVENSEQAARLVEKAIALNPNHPSWYHGSITMYYYMQGEADQALYHAERYALDGSLVSQALHVVALVQSERFDEGRIAYRDLTKMYPDFENRQAEAVRSWRLPNGLEAKFLSDLAIVGAES